MTSTINTTPGFIDTTYPVQGQDNPSQGFRDNYTNIVSNFNAASADIGNLQVQVDSILGANVANLSILGQTVAGNSANITILQGNVVTINSSISVLQGNIVTVESKLTTINANVASTNANVATITGNIVTINNTLSNAMFVNSTNTMNGNIIAGAAGQSSAFTAPGAGTITADATATDFLKVTVNGNGSTLAFVWPATGAYGKIRVLFDFTGAPLYINLPGSIGRESGPRFIGANTAYRGFSPTPTTTAGPYELYAINIGNGSNFMYDFYTIDGGTTVFMSEILIPK